MAPGLVIEGNGWLTPDGEFIHSEPASPIHVAGMPQTGHSKAILEWIHLHRADLVADVEKLIPSDGDIIDVPRQEIIDLAVAHGFVRVVDEDSALRYEGKPSAMQMRILKKSATRREQSIRKSS